jgi:D-3-phosphoglycerate dehydrogenase
LTFRFKVAITDSEYESHEIEKRVLSKIGAELVKFQCRTEDEVVKYCRDADGLLVQYAPITRKVIESLNAKVITRYGIGVDNIDVKAATEKNILVTNVVYDITDVADHTISLILSLMRKIPWVHKSTEDGEWDWRKFQPITRLKGKTVGIIGFGRIGRKVAQRLRGFEVELIAYDPYIRTEVFKEYGVEGVDLEALLKKSDIVTIHVGLTEETRRMIGEDELRKMRRGAFLINASRGGLVDEKALYTALKAGWISGAGLDVLEMEPPTRSNQLLSLSNVIITPHMAWYSTSSTAEIQEKAAENVARALSGQIPINLLNKEVLEKPGCLTR